MTRTITAKGGPLHGKRYTVPNTMTTFRHGAGTYRLTEKQAIWEADAPAQTRAQQPPLTGLARAAAHARNGDTVLLVGHTLRAAAEAFDEVAAQCDDADSIRRTSGAQRIDYANGGKVITTSQKRGARGTTVDVLYLLDEVSDDTLHELQPSLATSPVALTLQHTEG